MKEKKTEKILEHFKANPNKDLSPAEVGIALGYDPKLVASIAGRLAARDFIKRGARGRYKYVLPVSYDPKGIIKDARRILTNSFGKGILSRLELDEDYEDLTSFLAVLRQKFGSTLADNVMKQAISKNCKGKERTAIINKLGI